MIISGPGIQGCGASSRGNMGLVSGLTSSQLWGKACDVPRAPATCTSSLQCGDLQAHERVLNCHWHDISRLHNTYARKAQNPLCCRFLKDSVQ